MTLNGQITSATDASLREAAGEYAKAVNIPCFLDGVDGFATAHDEALDGEGDLKTLVTGDEESLAITVRNGDGVTKAFVNIDLNLLGDAPASIVEPGFYDKDGKLDPKAGEFGRPVLRTLTEIEGVELTMDLYSLIQKTPQGRKN